MGCAKRRNLVDSTDSPGEAGLGGEVVLVSSPQIATTQQCISQAVGVGTHLPSHTRVVREPRAHLGAPAVGHHSVHFITHQSFAFY